MDDILAGILGLLMAILLIIGLNWNKVELDKPYIIVDIVKHHIPDPYHSEKYKIVGDGLLNWVDFYTDSVYKPGDTLYFSRVKP